MGTWWIVAYRYLIAVAARMVPPSRRDAWREDWAGDFWRWLLEAAMTGDPQARKVLHQHTRDALRTAISERRGPILQHPLTPIVFGAAMVCAVAISTNMFSATRRLMAGIPYREPDRLVLLAQGPSTLGIRLGFLESDLKAIRAKTSTVESLATYGWFNAQVGGKNTLAAAVGPEFFDVLGAGPSTGQWSPQRATFLASQEFFNRELRADPHAIGRAFVINGTPLTLTGVLPANFSFLGLPISVWVPASAHTAPAADKNWWLSLRGVVARLKPGVTPSASETELLGILARAGLGRRNSKVFATQLRAMVNRPLWVYGGLLAMVLLGWTAWGLCAAYRSGEPWRFWAYFLAKSIPLVLAIFFFVFEVLANRAGAARGVSWGGELFALWILFCSVALFAAWAWRDQKRRCRVCLTSLREPLRIGTWGQMLLDPSGEEITCPFGHGSLYSSQSLIGRELADRWLDLKSLS